MSGVNKVRFISLSHASAFVAFDLVILLGLVLWNGIAVYVLLFHNMNDFGKFYYAAVAYINGQDMYGPSAATLMRLTETEWREWNLNPPHFHLLLLPLVLLPPYGALGVWSVASLLGLITSLRLMIQEARLKFSPWQWRLVALGLLSFVGTASLDSHVRKKT